MDFQFSLASVFSASPDPRSPVAILSDRTVNWGAFERDVAALTARLPADADGRWLLASDDPYAVAVGLLAVAFSRQSVVLPGNLKSGHIEALSQDVTGVLSHGVDLPAGLNARPILDRDTPDPPTPMPLTAFDSTAVEIVLYTSGTTGQPVAVAKSLRCFELEVATLERTFGGEADTRILSTVPPYHMYGLLFWVLWPLLVRRPLLTEVIRFPGELVDAAKAAGAAIVISSPAFLRRSVSALDLRAIDACLRGIYSSGGPLDPAVAAAYNARLSHPVVEVYGSTETGGVAHRSVYSRAEPPGWTLFADVEIDIDPVEGTLSVSSPLLPTDEPFVMGDRACLRPDGTFDLLGRRDRVMKIEERRVSLTEVESRLAGLEEIATARVVAVESTNLRTELAAVVVPSPQGWRDIVTSGKQMMTARMRAALGAHLEDVGIPRKWRFVRAMPESSHGKTTSADLGSLFAAGDGAVTTPVVLARSSDVSTARLTLRIPDDLMFLDGHFDGYPIVPGVVQIDWAIRYARDAFPITGTFHRLEAVKFFHVLAPGDETDLTIDYDAARGRMRFGFEAGATTFSSGRVLFGEPE
ncbi:MAG: AMP-binding protein [Thalassobaculaceae bacterium]|nr:AMP-binding protein [Thalassobaculaceae bacterium]